MMTRQSARRAVNMMNGGCKGKVAYAGEACYALFGSVPCIMFCVCFAFFVGGDAGKLLYLRRYVIPMW